MEGNYILSILQQRMESQHAYGLNNQQEEEDEGMLAKFKQMMFALKQEQLSPQLLPFKEDLFNQIKQQVKNQEERLNDYKISQTQSENQDKNNRKNFKFLIYSMQIQKIHWLLKQYLRIRIQKIRTYAFYYVKNKPQAQGIMSKNERDFLKKYVDIRYKYYQKNIFKNFNKIYRGVGGLQLFLGKPEQKKIAVTDQSKSDVLEPDLDQFVYILINRNPNEFRYNLDIPVTNVPQQQSQIASPNDIVFVPYKVAKDLIQRSEPGDIQFV